MHPITAQIRRVPSVSSLFNDDFTWSMGTSQAPTAGVAVLRRFSCLWRQRGDHRQQQQQWAGFSDAVMNASQIRGTLMQSNKHRLTAQKTRAGKKYLRQFLFYSLTLMILPTFATAIPSFSHLYSLLKSYSLKFSSLTESHIKYYMTWRTFAKGLRQEYQ